MGLLVLLLLLLLLTHCKSTSGGHCLPQPPPRVVLRSAASLVGDATLHDLSIRGDDQSLTPGCACRMFWRVTCQQTIMRTPGLLVSMPSSIYHYGGEVQNRAEWILLCSFMDPEIVFLVGVVYCYLLAF